MILVFCTKGPHVHWKITNKNSNLDQLGKHNDTLFNNARNTEILKVSWSVYMKIGMEQYLIYTTRALYGYIWICITFYISVGYSSVTSKVDL